VADDEARRALLRELIDDEAAAISRLQDQFLEEWTHERAQGLRQQFLEVLSSEEPDEVSSDAQFDRMGQVVLGGLDGPNSAAVEAAKPSPDR
jgi:hypothetical protein